MFKIYYHLETATGLSVNEVIDRFTKELELLDYQVITQVKHDSVNFRGYKVSKKYENRDSLSKIDDGELIVKMDEKIL